MLQLGTSLGKVSPILASLSDKKFKLPIPPSINIDWKESKDAFYAEYVSEENGILISHYQGSNTLSRTSIRFVYGKRYFSLPSEFLNDFESFSASKSLPTFEVFRCFEGTQSFEATLKVAGATSTIELTFYEDLTQEKVLHLMDQYPDMNISVKVFKGVDSLLFREIPAT